MTTFFAMFFAVFVVTSGAESSSKVSKSKPANPGLGKTDHLQVVELFDAIDQKQVHVKYIALDANRGNLIIENRQDQPILVRLPDRFGARPVLGQFGGGGGLGAGGGGLGAGGGGLGAGGGGGNQGVGGNFGGGGGGGNFGGGGGGNFGGGGNIGGFQRIPAGRKVICKSMTVCLDYGKPDPKPRIEYQLVRLETLTNDKSVSDACARLGQTLSPLAAQAVAWHRRAGLSWDSLSQLKRKQSMYTGQQLWFDSKTVSEAMDFVSPQSEYSPPPQDSSRRYERSSTLSLHTPR